jgi:hypothetical protein
VDVVEMCREPGSTLELRAKMSAAVTGGSTGSRAAILFESLGLDTADINNDMRSVILDQEASTEWNRRWVAGPIGTKYHHLDLDIRRRLPATLPAWPEIATG